MARSFEASAFWVFEALVGGDCASVLRGVLVAPGVSAETFSTGLSEVMLGPFEGRDAAGDCVGNWAVDPGEPAGLAGLVGLTELAELVEATVVVAE